MTAQGVTPTDANWYVAWHIRTVKTGYIKIISIVNLGPIQYSRKRATSAAMNNTSRDRREATAEAERWPKKASPQV